MTQTYNNWAETHLDGGDTSAFVVPLAAIARAHDPTVIGSVVQLSGKAHEDSVYIVLSCIGVYVSKLTLVATL